MIDWKEYTGSDEQIAEMCGADNGWIVMFYDSTQSEIHNGYPGKNVNMHAIKGYILCNPHPLADMICQQARTGQPVFMRRPTWLNEPNNKGHRWIYHDPTCKPIWDLPDTEYSFTEFKEEV